MVSAKRLISQQEDIDIIRRLGLLGARPAAIHVKLGSKEWTVTAINAVLRDYLGRGGAPGRRSTGSSAEMTRRQSEHFTLHSLLHDAASRYSQNDAKCAVEAFEVYRFVAHALDAALINVESAMFVRDRVTTGQIKTVHCRRCKVPRLAPSRNVDLIFVCADCESEGSHRAAPPVAPAAKTGG